MQGAGRGRQFDKMLIFLENHKNRLTISAQCANINKLSKANALIELSWIERLATDQKARGSNPFHSAPFRHRLSTVAVFL